MSKSQIINSLKRGETRFGQLTFHVMYLLSKFNSDIDKKGYKYIAYCKSDGTIQFTDNPMLNIDWSMSNNYFYAQANNQVVVVAPSIATMQDCLLKKIPFTSTSGLTATNIPAAIDELATKINSLVDGNEVSY